MMRLAAALFAVAAFVAALPVAPAHALLGTGLLGLLLAAVGAATLWRWAVTAGACVLLVDYAAGLWLFTGDSGLARPLVLGLCLLGLLETVELARSARGAAIERAVVRSQLLAWLGFVLGTAGVALLVMTAGGGLVTTIPAELAPFLAAAGALGALLTLATIVRGRSHEAE